MKFKSEEEVIEPKEDLKNLPEKEECPMWQAIDIAFSQLDLVNSTISSLRNTLDIIKNLYDKHDPR
jgi:hypothetical protein